MGTSKSSVPSPVPHLAWEQRDSTGDSPVSTQASDEAFCSAEVWRLTQAPQKLRVQAQDPAAPPAQEQPPQPRWPWHGAGGSWAHRATHVPCWGLTCSNTLHVIPHEVLLPKQRLSHSQEMGGKPGWQQRMGRERRRGPAAATQPLGTERWHLEQSHTRGTLHPDGDEHHQANSYNGSRMTQCPTLRVSPKLSTYCW